MNPPTRLTLNVILSTPPAPPWRSWSPTLTQWGMYWDRTTPGMAHIVNLAMANPVKPYCVQAAGCAGASIRIQALLSGPISGARRNYVYLALYGYPKGEESGIVFDKPPRKMAVIIPASCYGLPPHEYR